MKIQNFPVTEFSGLSVRRLKFRAVDHLTLQPEILKLTGIGLTIIVTFKRAQKSLSNFFVTSDRTT